MAWLDSWAKRIEITIPDTHIDDNLSSFPHLVYLSADSGPGNDDISAIFDELGSDANRKKIAVTTDDGETQLYVEIERWDHANEKAWLFINISSILASGGATIYIYYDSTKSENTTYVGDIGDTPSKSVWDSNFLAVYHMRDDTTSSIKDSTSNERHGTKKGANEPIESPAMIDKGQDFDGGNDYISLGNFAATQLLSVEFVGNYDADDWCCFVSKYSNDGNFYSDWIIGGTDSQEVFFITWVGGYEQESSVDTYGIGSNFYGAVTFDTDDKKRVYLDGSLSSTSADKGGDCDTHSQPIVLGAHTLGGGTSYVGGIIDEVRISDIARSAAWINATNNSLRDNINSFGSEELNEINISGGAISISLTQTGAFNPVFLVSPIDISVGFNSNGKFVAGVPFSAASLLNLSIGLVSSFNRQIRTDWKKFKGEGPWDLTEQPDKFGYLTNANWTGENGVASFLEDVGISHMAGLDNQHKPCGHWHKYPLVTYSYEIKTYIKGLIDSYEYDTNQSLYNFFIHITGNIYAVFYSNPSGATIRTIEIDSDGEITEPYIDSWDNAFSILGYGGAVRCTSPDSEPFIVALAYSVSTGTNRALVSTFSINADGTINKSLIDTYATGGLSGSTHHNRNIAYVTGSTYAFNHSNTSGHGVVTTISISNSGSITLIDTENFYDYVTNWVTNSFSICVYNNAICVAYQISKTVADPNRHQFFLKTINSIGGTLTVADSVQLYSSPSIHVTQYAQGVYNVSGFDGVAVFFNPQGSYGHLHTLAVLSGLITEKDSKVDWTSQGLTIDDVDMVNGTSFDVAIFKSTDLYLSGVNIDSSGNIGTFYSIQLIDGGLNAGLYCRCLEVSDGIFAIAYSAISANGWMATFGAQQVNSRVKDSFIDSPIGDEPVVWPI